MAEVQEGYASRCEECGGDEIFFDEKTGEHVCQRCGCVVATANIDTGPRVFDPRTTEDRSRVGTPLSLLIYDKGLSTTIGRQYKDASGRRLRPREKAKHYRLRKWHRRSKTQDYPDRNLSHALSYMEGVGYRLRLPRSVVETGSHIYRRALKMGLLGGAIHRQDCGGVPVHGLQEVSNRQDHSGPLNCGGSAQAGGC